MKTTLSQEESDRQSYLYQGTIETRTKLFLPTIAHHRLNVYLDNMRDNLSFFDRDVRVEHKDRSLTDEDSLK